MPFCIQNVFILLPPVLYAASIYMTLSRVIRSVGGEKHSIFKPLWLTRIFVTGDVLALAIQSGSAGMMVISDLASIAEKIVVGGLAFHIVIFGIFWTTATMFHVRMRRDPAALGLIRKDLKWEQILYMLYATSGLIMARSIFRMIEFIMGHDGYLLTTEWPLFVFDAVPMFIVMVIFWWWFPSILQNPIDNQESRDTVSGDSMIGLSETSRTVSYKGA